MGRIWPWNVDAARLTDRSRFVGKAVNQSAFDEALAGDPYSNIERFVTTVDAARGTYFTAGDFRPGDTGWMRNPYYYYKTEASRVDAFSGEGGSNVIAIGGGRYVSFQGENVYNEAGLARYIKSTFESVPARAQVDVEKEFGFKRIKSPHVPTFYKE